MDSVLQAIGQELRAERERNLISLAELARTTRIPLRNLELLEEGRSEELPGPVFIKGFLRAYYKALGL
ncbi:MAG: helix-turn-helix domain-containing protein, partial [Myxococcales bacterium]|nr:helix-turn-helix domain-containing protein [Myxococcales bacterium]